MNHLCLKIMLSAVVLYLGTPLDAWSVKCAEEDNTPAVQTALEELSHYADLAAADIRLDEQEAVFHLGDTAKARELGIHANQLANEEWIIQSDGNDIVIAGGGSRGTLYGVYNFIERILGVRWWNPFEEYVPEKREITLAPLHITGKPHFIMRNVFRDPQFPADNGRFAARNRINQDGQSPIGKEYGGDFTYGLPSHVHSIEREDGYLPVSRYFADHPEYYSLIGGKRIGDVGQGQLCFSNPELVPIFRAKLREFVIASEERAREKGIDAPVIYDISINDNLNFCECENCAREIAKYNRSGVLIRFLNAIAADLKEFRPGYFLQTLAYFGTIEAPKETEIADNIIVRLCDTNSNLTEDILSPKNQNFHDVITRWGEVGKSFAIWDYAITYDDSAGLPYPSEYVYETNFRFYADHGIVGVFMEHEYPDNADIYDYKVYLEAKLMEDPFQDVPALQEDFLHKYYGAAGAKVKEYRERLQKAATDHQADIAYFSPSSTGFKYIDLDTMLDCQRILEEAEQTVKDDAILLHRVRRARYGVDLALGYTLTSNYRIAADAAGVNPDELTRMIHAAQDRLLDTYEKTAERLLFSGREPLKIDNIRAVVQARKNSRDVPGIFAGRNALILPTESWQVHLPYVTLVSAPEAFSGFAYRIDIDRAPEYYHTNMATGVYDEKELKDHPGQTIMIPEMADGFHWYKAGSFIFRNPGFLYATNSWGMKFRTDVLAQSHKDQPVDLYIEAKFSGPAFGKSGTNAIELGSIAIATPQESTGNSEKQ